MAEKIRWAVLAVDIQNDFCPGGSLAVKNGEQVIEPTNRLIRYAVPLEIPIFASRDWHPPNTEHFNKWPVHCVANTPGAQFHPSLILPENIHIITKGMYNSDGYSAFDGLTHSGIPKSSYLDQHWKIWLNDALASLKITHLVVAGLATDYCVRATVLDALKRSYHTYLALNACRAVNLYQSRDPLNPRRSEPNVLKIMAELADQEIEPTDENIAIEEMRRAGAIITNTDAILELWTRPDKPSKE